MKIWMQLLAYSLCLPLSACAVGTLRVNALHDKHAKKRQTYSLWPGNRGVMPANLLFREVANVVNAALAARGYRLVARKDAELAVFVSYGKGSQRAASTTTVLLGGSVSVALSKTTIDTTNTAWLTLHAYDVAASHRRKAGVPVWIVTAAHVGMTLQNAMPLLGSAVSGYLDARTPGPVQVQIGGAEAQDISSSPLKKVG